VRLQAGGVVSPTLTDPEAWARAFILIPVGWRLAAVVLLVHVFVRAYPEVETA